MIFRLSTPFRFLWALARGAYARLAGYEIMAPYEIADARLLRCEMCLHLDPESRQCKICTCYIDGKTAIAIEGCPKRYWLSVWRKKARTST